MGQLIFHGQSCWEVIADEGTRLIIDPFLTNNPVADVGPEHFEDKLDYLLLTHGHSDHIGDAWDLLRATGATLISTYEIVSYAKDKQGVENAHPMHIGGGFDFPFGGWPFSSIGRFGGPGGSSRGRRPLPKGQSPLRPAIHGRGCPRWRPRWFHQPSPSPCGVCRGIPPAALRLMQTVLLVVRLKLHSQLFSFIFLGGISIPATSKTISSPPL